MIKNLCLLAVLIILQACQNVPSEQSTSVTSNVAYGDVLSEPYNVASMNFPYGNDLSQQIYYWPAINKPRSVLIFLHGGCWLNAFDYTHARALFTALAKQGVATFAIEYRRTGDAGGGWPGSLRDIQQALPKVKQQLEAMSLGALPIYLAGHSAGGHLALLAAQSSPFAVNGVIGLAAITDPVAYAHGDNSCQTATPEFFNGMPDELPEAYLAATPVVENINAPVILLQGDADSIVPVGQSQLVGSQRIISSGAGHFDWLHSGTGAYQLFLNQLLKGTK